MWKTVHQPGMRLNNTFRTEKPGTTVYIHAAGIKGNSYLVIFYSTDIELIVHLSLSFSLPLSLCWIDLHAPSVESVMTAGALSGGRHLPWRGWKGHKEGQRWWVAGQKGKRVGRVVQVLNRFKNPFRKISETPEASYKI